MNRSICSALRAALRALRPVLATAATLVALAPAQAAFVLNTVDVESIATGGFTSLQLNASGFPVISYSGVGVALKLAVCGDPTCTTSTLSTVDTGQDTSLQLNASGFPVISYMHVAGAPPIPTQVKLAVCADATCSTSTLTTVDSGGLSGVSLQLNASGFPVISYSISGGGLGIAVCNDATCSTSTIRTVDSAGGVGIGPSLQLNGGNPVISYFDNATAAIKLAVCNDATCSTSTIRTVGVGAIPQSYSSLQLNASGFPVISYYDASHHLTLAVCGDLTCTTPTITTVDGALNVGSYNSLQLNGGNPVISYEDATNRHLKLAVCGDPTCTTPILLTVDNGVNTGRYTSLRLNGGNPVIGYTESATFPTGHIKLAVFTPATVASVGVPANANYVTGQALDFTVNWSEPITVTGTPMLPLTIGATARNATYLSGSGTSALVFRYTVLAADNDNDGVALGAALALNGGTVVDAVLSHAATLALNGVGATTGVLVNLTYTVTASAGANGSINPSGAQVVAAGATPTFTATPGVGYTASFAGSTCAGTQTGNNYLLNPVAAGCTVVASFTLNSYTVTSSGGGASGTITPPSQPVSHGSTASFTVTPSVGYTASVGGTCPTGSLVGTTYTTGPITGPCNVAATFTLNSYTVTSSAGTNGTITPPSQTVAYGGTTTFTVTPNAGYSASVGGTCGGTLAGTTYTTNAITANCTVSATFTVSPVTTFTGPTATGSGSATVSFSGGGPTCGFAPQGNGPLQSAFFIAVQGHPKSPPAGSPPSGVAFPHGLLDFVLVNCTPGATISFTVTYPAALPAGTQYWKYGPTSGTPAPHWYALAATISGSTATFAVTDGGAGDDDLAANGTVVDQGGPGVPGPVTPIQIPTLSEWALLVLVLLLGLAGVQYLDRERRRR